MRKIFGQKSNASTCLSANPIIFFLSVTQRNRVQGFFKGMQPKLKSVDGPVLLSVVTVFCTFIERTLEPSKQYIEKRHKVIQKKNELTGTKKNPRYISVSD